MILPSKQCTYRGTGLENQEVAKCLGTQQLWVRCGESCTNKNARRITEVTDSNLFVTMWLSQTLAWFMTFY
jgi:hypothetical protein